ncbi:MAG: ABC transporter permease [Rhodobacteraceae bacterium]|nr:ABC transporter permease [Paracoccaceae bacterium]
MHRIVLSIRWVGRLTIRACAGVGRFTIFTAHAFSHVFRPPFYFRELLNAVLAIGYFSLPVVALTALFAGGALALQIYAGGSRFDAQATVPSVVAIGMVRELGPVLCGLMVAGRAASAIAAELATMKVTDQIDALTTLSTDPVKFLVTPRVVAAALVMPVLTGVGDILGIMGGYLVGVYRLGFNSAAYLQTTLQFLQRPDVTSGLAKAAVFGLIIALVGCYFGMNSGRGAKGVGRATTGAVAASSALIIASNYVLTEIFFPA